MPSTLLSRKLYYFYICNMSEKPATYYVTVNYSNSYNTSISHFSKVSPNDL